MGMPGTDFLTRKQMKEQVALPKVGVTYDDGSGKSRSFAVGDLGDFGSLDAAFGAAAAGVQRRPDNIQLANSLNKPQEAPKVKAKEGSGVVVHGDTVSLATEDEGAHRHSGRVFATGEGAKPGWRKIADVDKETRGPLVGPALNVVASADSSKREIGDKGCWSRQVSRCAFKKNKETGAIQFYNYFRTVYETEWGRTVGMSEETEVLVGEFVGGAADYCAKPIVDGSGKVTGIEFGTSAELKKGTPSKTVSFTDGGSYGVKPVFVDGVLSELRFGSDSQLRVGGFANKVETYLGCPYSSGT